MKKEKVQQVAHLLAGVALLIQSLNLMEMREFKAALGFFVLALLFVVVSAVHKWFVKIFQSGDVPLFLLEAVALIYNAWDMLEMERITNAVLLAIMAVAVAGAAVYSLVADTGERLSPTGSRRSKRSGKRRSKSMP